MVMEWIKRVSIKTVKTMAQVACGMITTGMVLSDIDIKYVLSSMAVAGIACILMNLSQLEEK